MMGLHWPIISVESEDTREKKIMLHDFDEINAILNGMVDDGMIEPIDEPNCDPFDYAEVTGLWDEMYPEPEEMVDENGTVWYVS
jgi:hypothetical protein